MSLRTVLFWAAFASIVSLAAVLRLQGLQATYGEPDQEARLLYRPMHGDEAIQAVKLGRLLEEGAFDYDPSDLHGPGLLYSTVPFAWARGEPDLESLTEFTLRLTTALYGIGLVLLLSFLRRPMGSIAVLAAGLVVAGSPIMVFYSRYYIMEIPMVFWITVAMIALWHYVRRPSYLAAIIFGVAGGVTHATKETGAISFFTMALSMVVLVLWCTRSRHGETPVYLDAASWRHLAASLVVGLAVSMALYSVFFQNGQAILDSFRTYFLYFDRALHGGDTPEAALTHKKPALYYLKTLLWNRDPAGGPYWSEWLLLLFGGIGLVASFTNRPGIGHRLWHRFLALQTFLTALIYALIPYKTPWSMLCWVYTLALLAGHGFAFLWSFRKPFHAVRAVALGILAFGLFLNLQQIDNSIRRFRADNRNPFVYAHTSASLLQLVRNVRDMAAVHPEGKNMKVAVYHDEWGWPLPWYFRDFTNLAYSNVVPADPEPVRQAAVIILPLAYDPLVENVVAATHQFETIYGYRDTLKIVVYVENSLYQRFLDSR